MRLMSYNVQTGTPTPTRAAQMLNNILTFDADIVGTQEVNARWLCIFKGTGILDKYEYVGNPRGKEDDVSNGNEYSGILFKKDMFRLIDSGTLWLSDTPHEISRIPGCAYTRIMTYALLERKSDGKRLLHVNSHLDYQFPANTEHNKILLKLTKSLGYEGVPTIYTGDFNMTPDCEGYEIMQKEGGTTDAKKLAKQVRENTTCGDTVIDFCFLSNGDFQVESYDVHETEGSDHNPLHIVFDFAK